MSGPFEVSIILISERKSSRGCEIIVAASTFLSLNYTSILPVSNDNKCRQDFLEACENQYSSRNLGYSLHAAYNIRPREYAKNIVEPSIELAKKVHFWLAFDQQGYDLARRIIETSGESPDKPFYKTVNKVNLFEHVISDPPENDFASWFDLTYEQLDPWRKAIRNIQSDYS